MTRLLQLSVMTVAQDVQVSYLMDLPMNVLQLLHLYSLDSVVILAQMVVMAVPMMVAMMVVMLHVKTDQIHY